MVEQSAAASESTDPAALSLALVGASREKADAYLDDQRHHIHEQLKQIHLDIFEKWLGVALRLATLCVGIGAATGVCLMVWDAAHSNGLLIEPFQTPPDMAAKGLSGQVVASQLLDRLTAMQNATQSYRAPQSYANNWGDDIKVEIPETGVSIGEFRRFLRDWLGHDTHISGEVWHADTGIAISARPGGDGGAVFTGPPSEFDALLQKAAEHVYARTQPFRYGNYLRPLGRFREAHASYLRLTTHESARERGWAWYGIAVLAGVWQGKSDEALWAYRKAVSVYPDLAIAWSGVAASESQLGHNEAALAARRKVEDLIGRGGMADIAPRSVEYVKLQWTHRIPEMLGDYGEAIRRGRLGAQMPDQQGFSLDFRLTVARALAFQHDAAAASAAMRNLPPPLTFGGRVTYESAPLTLETARENWKGVLQAAAAMERVLANYGNPALANSRQDVALIRATQLRPWAALARARLGDVRGARTLIETTPADCYDCQRIRGAIAEMARRPAEADAWFARAMHDGPSLPFAATDWGNALLRRGQPDAAIGKFMQANKLSPKFADPLEGWGEALMAKNQSHRALAKFAEAEKYAPNWGRLHLKWGQALAYAGKPDEAKEHFARAAALDLNPSEKAELVGAHR